MQIENLPAIIQQLSLFPNINRYVSATINIITI